MDRKEEYKIENLTMLQIQYLIELNKLEKKERCSPDDRGKVRSKSFPGQPFFQKMHRRRGVDGESGFYGKWKKKVRLALQDDPGCP